MGDEQDKQMMRIGGSMPESMRKEMRWACALVGVAGVAAGVAAVFIAASDVGSIGLLFLGALFLVIGIAGVTPLKLKIGDNEIDFAQMQAIQDIARGVVDTPNPKDRMANTPDILALSEMAPRLATPALASIAFRTQVLRVVREFAWSHRSTVSIETPEECPEVKYDAILSDSTSQRSVAVQVNLCKTLEHRGLDEITRRAEDYFKETKQSGTLLVTTENRLPANFHAKAILKRYLQIVVMRGDKGELSLQEELAKALA